MAMSSLAERLYILKNLNLHEGRIIHAIFVVNTKCLHFSGGGIISFFPYHQYILAYWTVCQYKYRSRSPTPCQSTLQIPLRIRLQPLRLLVMDEADGFFERKLDKAAYGLRA